MENDDQQIGRILTRREILALAGTTAALSLFTKSSANQAQGLGKEQTKGIVVTPAQTEGPYFVDEKLNRSDVRSDPATGKISKGIPLVLTLRISEVTARGAQPLEGAVVDIWHCDALGKYSDEPSEGTSGTKFLRGYQVSGKDGMVKFTTVYPGWYRGRAVHIHFKVRSKGHDFTSQLYFEDSLSEKVFAAEPYKSRGAGVMKNAEDGLFRDGGKKLLLSPVAKGDGHAATFDVGLAF